jgi:hypothetical protein
MLAGRLPSRCRIKRHARRLGLRSLRVVRRHYFSLLSAAVLGVALMLTLSHSGIDSTRAEAPVTPEPPAPAVRTAPSSSPTPTPAPEPPSRLLVYYVVDSEEQKQVLELAILSHTLDQAQRGTLGLAAPTFRYFLIARNADEEAQAIIFLDDLATMAPNEGYALRVVDAR